MAADLSYGAFLALCTTVSYNEWLTAGSPTDRTELAKVGEQGRLRVQESLGKLPVLQDERGVHLDELSPPSRRCETCGSALETTRVERTWMLPPHLVPEQTTPCMGAYAQGSES